MTMTAGRSTDARRRRGTLQASWLVLVAAVVTLVVWGGWGTQTHAATGAGAGTPGARGATVPAAALAAGPATTFDGADGGAADGGAAGGVARDGERDGSSEDATSGARRRWWTPPTPAFGIDVVSADPDAPGVPVVEWANDQPIPARMVLLVHGLDDPGWIWKDLAPTLVETGFVVATMTYPNDGPIALSADLFAESLRSLRMLGVERVDVIAHSMGGLVTRDVLTRDVHYDGDARGDGELPAIERLIMCGTPNGGSQFARVRVIGEVREHITRALGGRGHLFGGRVDGNGDAGRDLIPGSDFLRDLNARPPADHVAHTIIAARIVPVTGDHVDRLRGEDGEDVEDAGWWRRRWRAIRIGTAKLVERLVTGMGDGLVTLDSAGLEGIEDVVEVEGNHASLLSRVAPFGTKDPPAIPIILDRLGSPESGAAAGGASSGVAGVDGDDATDPSDG